MNIILTQNSIGTELRLRQFFQRHPEWWLVILTVCAWGLMVPHAVGFGISTSHQHEQHQEMMSDHESHDHSSMPDDMPTKTTKSHMQSAHEMGFSNELFSWFLMIMAMMLPLVLEPFRWVAFQSFHHRRYRSVLFALIGYLLPWAILGAGAAWLHSSGWFSGSIQASALFAAAAIWVLIDLRQRAAVFLPYDNAAGTLWLESRSRLPPFRFNYRVILCCHLRLSNVGLCFHRSQSNSDDRRGCSWRLRAPLISLPRPLYICGNIIASYLVSTAH